MLQIDKTSFTPSTVLVKINLPPASGDVDVFYICTKDSAADVNKVFTHQGIGSLTQVRNNRVRERYFALNFLK